MDYDEERNETGGLEEDQHIIEEARAFLRRAADAESENRSKGLEDVKFAKLGEQWPAEIQNSRQLEQRPMLTINKTDAYLRNVSNQQRQQRPRMMVHGMNTRTDKKLADVVQGICRHIEVQSFADTAYDTAFDWATSLGWGYWRLRADYIDEKSFDQDIFIETIDNPFTVYIDPSSILPDGSDMMCCMITELMSKEAFEAEYPEADISNLMERGPGDSNAEWITKDQVRIAEYYDIDKVPAKLYKLSDGRMVFDDELPNEEERKALNIEIIDTRDSYKRQVCWYKLTGAQVLDRRILPGRYIPVIPVYGNIVNINGKRKKFGMVRFMKDPQRMVNYWETAMTESIALAPKAKWLMAEGQDEDHENEWAAANVSAKPVLRYKPTDVNGEAVGPPQRLQPEPPPVGIIQALAGATQNLREVSGIADPAQRITGNVSGKALISEQQQSDNATYHYYDNLTRSLQHTGRIILSWIPTYYDQEREMRIIGDDGKPSIITINQRQTTAEGEIINNNIAVGEYSIVMDTGPGYNSKRQAAVEAMTPLMAEPNLMQVIGDLFFRNSDFPGAEIIADRLAAMNPLSQIDEQSDIPPQVQMMIKQLQKQLQDAQGQIQQQGMLLKSRMDVEQLKQAGETQRAHLNAAVKAHDTETWARENLAQQEQGDQTKLLIEQIRAEVAKQLKEMDHKSQVGTEKTETRI